MTQETRWLAWGLIPLTGLVGFWLQGMPPSVDLAAHAAQFETLKGLLQGDPLLGDTYGWHVPLGYGLEYALFLPVAFIWNGAVAAKLVMCVGTVLLPVATWALLRALHRSGSLAWLAAPWLFSMSTWYGLLSGVVAVPLVLFCLAANLRLLEQPSRRRFALACALMLATSATHLLAFAVLCVLSLVALAVEPVHRAHARWLVLPLVAPTLIVLPKVYFLAACAVHPGHSPPTEYAAMPHLMWFFRNEQVEGLLGVAGPIALTLVLLALWVRHRAQEPRLPLALFITAVVLYVLTPKTLSGIFLACVRLPVFAGLLSLGLVDVGRLPRRALVFIGSLTAISLFESAHFAQAFRNETQGLEACLSHRASRHGWINLGPKTVLGSRNPYAMHLGQWVTAIQGGRGNGFFADAPHHPVHFQEGRALPDELGEFTARQLGELDEIYVFGAGPLPASLDGFRLASTCEHWRRLDRAPPSGQANRETPR